MLVFVIIGLVGLLFLVVSSLFGGDHEVGHDHDFGHEGPSPFSSRVISLFLTGFGFTGAIGQSYDLGYPASSGLGVGMGLILAFTGFKLIAFFTKQGASSTLTDDELIGHVGQVTVPIPAGGLGQIVVDVHGRRVFPSARNVVDAAVAEGAQVKIIRSSGNQVVVEQV